MFSPSKLLWAALLAALAGSLMALGAEAGTVVAERAAPDERAQPGAPVGTGPRYQVRCWQYGRLLFEEQDLQLGDEPIGGLKLRGTDRQRHPVMVTDTGNATCLIRSNPPVRR